MNQSTLTRRLGCAPQTLRSRIAAGIIQPDGEVEIGSCREVSLIFRADRLPEIARLLKEPQVILSKP